MISPLLPPIDQLFLFAVMNQGERLGFDRSSTKGHSRMVETVSLSPLRELALSRCDRPVGMRTWLGTPAGVGEPISFRVGLGYRDKMREIIRGTSPDT